MTKHSEALEKLNLQPGDKVILTKYCASDTEGWRNSWVEKMYGLVGKEFTVDKVVEEYGVKVKESYLRLPAHCLEKL